MRFITDKAQTEPLCPFGREKRNITEFTSEEENVRREKLHGPSDKRSEPAKKAGAKGSVEWERREQNSK
jgi:hypothetical protein